MSYIFPPEGFVVVAICFIMLISQCGTVLSRRGTVAIGKVNTTIELSREGSERKGGEEACLCRAGVNGEIKLGSGGQLILTSMEICRDLAPLKLAIHWNHHLFCTMRENINLSLDLRLYLLVSHKENVAVYSASAKKLYIFDCEDMQYI